jgi:sialidase-1
MGGSLRRTVTVAAVALGAAIVAACTPDVGPAGPVADGDRCTTVPADAPAVAEQSTIFQGGDEYPVYRIPAVTTTSSGVVLAFAEARPSIDDPGSGRIDVVMRRSLDCGRTWEPQVVLADNGPGDAHNPTAVVAPGPDGSETAFLFYSQRPDHPGREFDIAPGLASSWVRTSTDDGATWSEPRQLTGLSDPSWRVVSFGPGQAIVTRWGNDTAPAGRLIVPGWYSVDGTPGTGSFVIFSDDGGTTWQRGGLPQPGTTESQVLELADGTVVLDARREGGRRAVYHSTDGGETWSAPTAGLPMVPIMSGLLRDRAVRDGDAVDRIWQTGVSTGGRYDLRVWSSEDEGATWSEPTVLLRAAAQYSMLTPLGDGTLGIVYESVCVCEDPDTGVFRAGLGVRMLRFDPERVAGAG